MLLYTIVQQTNAHLVSRKESKGKWLEVSNILFSQDEMLSLREPHYSPDHRQSTSERVKDKFNSLQKVYIDQMRLGANKSGNSEDGPPPYFEMASVIQTEKDEKSAQSKEKSEAEEFRKQHLNRTEEQVLRKLKGGGPKKNADGTFTGTNKRRREGETWEMEMVKMMKGALGGGELEVETRVRLLRWIDMNNKTMSDLFQDAGMADLLDDSTMRSTVSALNRLGVKGLINVYCGRGGNLSADRFLTQMERMGVETMYSNLTLGVLEDWNEQSAYQESEQQLVPQPTPATERVVAISSTASSTTRQINLNDADDD